MTFSGANALLLVGIVLFGAGMAALYSLAGVFQ